MISYRNTNQKKQVAVIDHSKTIFFRIINADSNNYFDEKRDYKQDVKVFWQHLMSDKRPVSLL